MWPAICFNGDDYIKLPIPFPGIIEDPDCTVVKPECQWGLGPEPPDASSNVLMNGFSMAVIQDKFGSVVEIGGDCSETNLDCVNQYIPDGIISIGVETASSSVMVNGIPAAKSYTTWTLQEWPPYQGFVFTTTVNVLLMS